MSFFPIVIQCQEGKRQGKNYLVENPEQIPQGLSFKVILTNVENISQFEQKAQTDEPDLITIKRGLATYFVEFYVNGSVVRNEYVEGKDLISTLSKYKKVNIQFVSSLS